jgi:hypothetical protein
MHSNYYLYLFLSVLLLIVIIGLICVPTSSSTTCVVYTPENAVALPPLPKIAIDGSRTIAARPFSKTLHMLQIPWTRDQKLKTNKLDFDITWFKRATEAVPLDWTVKLWTFVELEEMVKSRYSQKLWEYIWQRVTRPVQAVDLLRLLVTYEFGGASIQYKSKLLKPTEMTALFMPKDGKTSKVFIEQTFTQKECLRIGKTEPIRQGLAQTRLRLSFGFFSASKHAVFIGYLIDLTLRNLALYDVINNYDVLFISGNDMISTAYNDAKNTGLADSVELGTRKASDEHVTVFSTGSWRSR